MELDLLERFEAHLRLQDDLSDNTVRAYGGDMRQYFRYLEAHSTGPVRAERHDVVGFLGSLRQAGTTASTRKLSAVRRLYRYLAERGEAVCDPTEVVRAPHRQGRLPMVPSVKEVERMLEKPRIRTATGLGDRALLHAVYSTGLRGTKVVRLDLKHVDVGGQWVRFRAKGGNERVVPFGGELTRWLGLYLDRARPELATADWGGAFFLNCRGGAQSKGMLENRPRVRRAREHRQAGLAAHAPSLVRNASVGRGC